MDPIAKDPVPLSSDELSLLSLDATTSAPVRIGNWRVRSAEPKTPSETDDPWLSSPLVPAHIGDLHGAPRQFNRAANGILAKTAALPSFPHVAPLIPAATDHGILGFTSQPGSPPKPNAQHDVQDSLSRLPLVFEANEGQTNARVDFLTRAGGYTAFLTPTGAIFSIEQTTQVADTGRKAPVPDAASKLHTARSPAMTKSFALEMQMVGSNPAARATGVGLLSGKVNYFIGNDSSRWHSGISTFGVVQYEDVYPGIDLL
jgi:hypothetical protein